MRKILKTSSFSEKKVKKLLIGEYSPTARELGNIPQLYNLMITLTFNLLHCAVDDKIFYWLPELNLIRVNWFASSPCVYPARNVRMFVLAFVTCNPDSDSTVAVLADMSNSKRDTLAQISLKMFGQSTSKTDCHVMGLAVPT